MPQSGTGRITLYGKKGDIVVLRTYDSLKERAAIIAYWGRLYGKQFAYMSYGIEPFIRQRALDMMDRVEKIVELRIQNKTYKQIGERFGLVTETIQETILRYRPDMIGKYNQTTLPDNKGRKRTAA